MYHRILLSEMLWTDAASGKFTQTQRLGGSVSLVQNRFIRPMRLVTRTRSPSRSLLRIRWRICSDNCWRCGSPGSGPSSGSGSCDGGKVVAASGETQIRQPTPVVTPEPAELETLLRSLLSGQRASVQHAGRRVIVQLVAPLWMSHFRLCYRGGGPRRHRMVSS